MAEHNPDVQAVGLLLLLSFCVALILVGILMSKTRFWGASRTPRVKKAGFFLTVSGSIVGAITLIVFIYNQIVNK